MGAAAVGVASGCGSSSPADPRRRLSRVGLQLYTVRDQMKADLPGTLANVAAIGYKEVEFAGYFGRTPAAIRELLAVNGLTSPSTHVPIESMRKEWPKVLDDARQIGHQWVVIPWLPEAERGGLDGWKRLAGEFNTAARAARDAGLRFAYHNHDFELTPIPAAASGGTGPTIPLDVLLAETDPSLVDFEMDLYWVVKGGGDPSSYFKRFENRFPLVHVKDSAGPPSHTMIEVGKGSIDFARIFADGEKSIKHFFVEHDQPADPMASIRTSYNYLQTLEY
jgi:sugar phosphate isomerase/epimerase